jgi:CelD/BcsL family acetyltransferase involved in cellulose biosynthesis
VTELRLGELEPRVEDDEWGGLAHDVGNVFATPEWISTWWRHFGKGRSLRLTSCRDADGRLLGVLPLYLWKRRPLPVVRFAGHGPGDALGPLCRPEHRPLVAAALQRRAAELRAVLVVAENVPAEEGWSELLRGRVVETEDSPVLAFEGSSWDELLASWSRNLRSQVRSRERRLLADHDASFRLADDPERFDRDLDRLFELHRERWPTGSNFTRAERFQRDFARLALGRGWARLWFLEVAGEACAAWYGFRFANVESYYQAGRVGGWDRYSPGFVLLAHSIREAAQDGAREYRFLRGGEEFKSRFASWDHGLETIVLGRGGLGRTVLAAALRLPRPVLRRLSA